MYDREFLVSVLVDELSSRWPLSGLASDELTLTEMSAAAEKVVTQDVEINDPDGLYDWLAEVLPDLCGGLKVTQEKIGLYLQPN